MLAPRIKVLAAAAFVRAAAGEVFKFSAVRSIASNQHVRVRDGATHVRQRTNEQIHALAGYQSGQCADNERVVQLMASPEGRTAVAWAEAIGVDTGRESVQLGRGLDVPAQDSVREVTEIRHRPGTVQRVNEGSSTRQLRPSGFISVRDHQGGRQVVLS